ncbi:hypothetical protein ACXO28_07780 [Lactobacillus delbrueckii subsp. bulgaricus]
MLTKEWLKAKLEKESFHDNGEKQRIYLEPGKLKNHLPKNLASDYLFPGDKQAYLELTAYKKKLLLPSNKRQQLQHFKTSLANCQS